MWRLVAPSSTYKKKLWYVPGWITCMICHHNDKVHMNSQFMSEKLFLFNLIQPTGIRKCELDFPMWFYTWKFEFQIWKLINNKCELQIDRNVPFGLRSYVSLSLELQEGLYITDNFDFELDWCIDSVMYYCQYILIFRFLCEDRISFILRYIFLHDGV